MESSRKEVHMKTNKKLERVIQFLTSEGFSYDESNTKDITYLLDKKTPKTLERNDVSSHESGVSIQIDTEIHQ
jgi:hypothetical protein